ncbi:calcium-binding protein [Tardibacter chloracetimidivorans]|uniref:Calcium-binding protein n=1 Tax=Tardibacter chloracetimidivorans TaxID=1921510 RepID=A0A1L3ZUX4_9SPHN|nr:excalibur calcium-binding domain-containing protein [Tardibacter chloracetimidivorans]API59456.1 calcium-binding protein [Tardibacter chloracetimidivorans]
MLVGATPALAHPGGLNAAGCHNNHRTGAYHCHHDSSLAASARQSFNPGSASSAFRNCAEARGAGAAPVYRGSPGYGPHLDRDGDGVGCEPYQGR